MVWYEQVALSIGSHVTLTDQSSLVHDLLHVMARESTNQTNTHSLSSSSPSPTATNSHVLAPYLLDREEAISLMASCAARFPISSLVKDKEKEK